MPLAFLNLERHAELRLATIFVSQARAGMILSADVLDKRGRLLVPKGVELKDKHLDAFPAWGIDQIDVQGEAEKEDDLEPWALEAAEREIARVFAHTNPGHPALAALRDACHRRLARHMQDRGSSGVER